MDIIISQDFFPEIGGAHRWLYEVYKRWPDKVFALVQDYSRNRSLRRQQTIFDNQENGALDIKRYDIAIDDINFFSLSFVRRIYCNFKLLNRLTKKYRTVNIHCVRAFPEAIPAVLFKKTARKSVKLVTYAHGEEILTAQSSRQLSGIAGWVYGNSDIIISNSISTKSLLTYYFQPEHVEIIHPGVDTSSFNINESLLSNYRTKFGWPEDTQFYVPWPGWNIEKNHAAVISVVSALRQEGFNIAYIAGSDGEKMCELQQLVNQLGISEFVKFTGYISEHERIMTFLISDIHVMPSIQSGPMIEGYGIVFIEAAAAGVPSICGNIGGQAEAVINGKTGIVIDGTDLDALKNAIAYLIKDRTVRTQMGKAGKKWANENDWDVIAKRTCEKVFELRK